MIVFRCLTLLLTLCTGIALAGPLPTTDMPEDDGPWVVRAYFASKTQLNRLTRRTEPWEVRHDQGYAVVEVANRFEYTRLLGDGFQVAVDPALSAFIRTPQRGLASVPGYACYRTVEETYTSMDALVAQHASLAKLVDIGDSWNKIHHPGSGYDLRVLKLTNSAISGPKPRMFVMGAVHAREYTTAETVMRFAESLLQRYATDADVRWMLDHHELHVLPHSNPDGRKKAELGQLWRKNLNENYCAGNPNQRGADLNRNFPFEWGAHGGSSDEPCSEIFRGASPASEPETVALINYLRDIFPDVRPADFVTPAPADSPGVFMDVHSYGQLVMWPWHFRENPAPNGPAMATLGRRLAWFNNYRPLVGVELYFTDGGSKDFVYGELGVPALSLELGSDFFESCASFEANVVDNNLRALEYLLRSARAPYQEPAGPAVRDILSAPVELGEPLQLAGLVSDTDSNTSNGIEVVSPITQVDAWLNALPWSTSPNRQASAADGSFDSSVELWQIEFPSSELPLGSHVVYLRGSDPQLGSTYARSIEVVSKGSTAKLQGDVRNANTGALLTVPAQVRLGPFGTLSLPAEQSRYALRAPSGSYALTVSADGYVAATRDIQLSAPATTSLDLQLLPICTVFADSAEQGLSNFSAQSPWGINTARFTSPPASFSDSPSGSYAPNADVSLSLNPLDLRYVGHTRLKFQSYCDTEASFDFGRVEISTDGNTWTEVWRCQSDANWRSADIDLSALNDVATAYIRFRFSSDGAVQLDGWSIDDLRIEGTGAICGGPVDEVFKDGFE